MKAIFDSCILIDLLNGVKQADGVIKKYDGLFISVITRIEVLSGARTQQHKKLALELLEMFCSIPLDDNIANKAVDLRLEKKIKTPDAIIEATALICDCALITRNSKDFDEGLAHIIIPYKL